MFAPGASSLEGRPLPSIGGLPAAAVAFDLKPSQPIAAAVAFGPQPSQSIVTAAAAPAPFLSTGDPPGSHHDRLVLAGAGATAGPAGPSPSSGRAMDRVTLAEANIQVDGKPTAEFALADATRNVILVKVGMGPGTATILSGNGISAPSSVVLADVNGDGIPDLLVSNSGGGDVLVFPGLPGGGVVPRIGSGFPVGLSPSGITIGDVNGDGIPDVIVANKGSNSVTVLLGSGTGAAWTLTPGPTLATGIAPVQTALQDVSGDGKLDLFVCNSGSNTVTLYEGLGNGSFNPIETATYNVGLDPSEMFIGRFDRRPQLDLVTMNTGSNDLTFLAGIASGVPQVSTYSSGGTGPDAAFAVDLNHDGVLDLVVANGGDGRVALLQGGAEGLRLVGVMTRPDIPVPTALAPATSSANAIDFFAANAGQDAALLLHFDLGPASAFLSTHPGAAPGGESGAELIAQLLPMDESDLELIAVLLDVGPGYWTKDPEREARAASTVTALYTPTEGQGEDGAHPAPATPPEDAGPAPPPGSPPSDPAAWARYVLDLDRALGRPRGAIGAVAARDEDELGDDRPAPVPPSLDRTSADPDAGTDAIDEALRVLWADEPTPGGPDDPADPGEGPGDLRGAVDDLDAPVRSGGTVPIVASTLVLASRLILLASPPRPPASIRRGAGRRAGAAGPTPARPGPL